METDKNKNILNNCLENTDNLVELEAGVIPFLVLKQNISITTALECRLHQSEKIDESPWERTSSA